MAADVRVHLDLKVPMRDGVVLSADLYRPPAGERFPALLCRTIYDNQRPRDVDWACAFARHGYAVVVQDCRGRYDSDGRWEPYVCEAADGYDTQQWIGAQPWCDGTIGTYGVSYVGFTQILPAPFRSPYVKALVPIANQEDNFGHIYCDGVLQLQNAVNFAWIGDRTVHSYLAFAFGAGPWAGGAPGEGRRLVDPDALYRRLPLATALDDLADRPAYRLFLDHPTFDDYWKSYSMKGRYRDVDVPALFITGWYDNLVHEQFKCFAGWTREARSQTTRERTKILVGPWHHTGLGSADPFGDVDFGAAAAVDLVGVQLRWYDRRLRGAENGVDDDPAVRIFVMGANVWRDEREWPLARTMYTKYYLRSGGRANTLEGDGRLDQTPPEVEPPDTYTYDPDDPVPTRGGQSMMRGNTGPLDRRDVERREDVLVYTTDPLPSAVEATGPVSLTLYAASSAPDTDFTGALVDVHPDGRAIIVCEGIVRARFTESTESETLIEPGRTYAYRISLWETSHVFLLGHRIRLEVSSSNFPRFNRNLNTGEALATGTRWQTARQTVMHRLETPSHLVLPVIPAPP
jgi:putative CocE/NonD family hydrolase